MAEQDPAGQPLRRGRAGGSRRAGRGDVLRYLALVISAVLFLLPFYLIVRNALSGDIEITAPDWTIFPTEIHWENFASCSPIRP